MPPRSIVHHRRISPPRIPRRLATSSSMPPPPPPSPSPPSPPQRSSALATVPTAEIFRPPQSQRGDQPLPSDLTLRHRPRGGDQPRSSLPPTPRRRPCAPSPSTMPRTDSDAEMSRPRQRLRREDWEPSPPTPLRTRVAGSVQPAATPHQVRVPSSSTPVHMEEEFKELRERFTWRKQTTPEGMFILSPIELQYKDWCLYFALKVTLESNFRVQMSQDIKFSVHQLYEISKMVKQQFPKQTSAHRLLIKLKDTGLVSEDDYKAKSMFGVSYYLKKVYTYKLDSLNDIRHALCMLRECGPLLAVIYISQNYDKCTKTGEVYKYDSNFPIGNEKKPITHAITVISFALENGPFLHCQDSQGLAHGEGGYLKVDVTSIKELYAFTIK